MPPDEGRRMPTDTARVLERHDERLTKVEKLADKHDLELHGERGVYEALTSMEDRLKWVNRALWAIALSIIGAAVAIILAGGAPT